MPVKLGSKLPTEHSEARIEIIPLIDIMFFLLASFILVSLSMAHLKGVKVDLPTATTATADTTVETNSVLAPTLTATGEFRSNQHGSAQTGSRWLGAFIDFHSSHLLGFV